MGERFVGRENELRVLEQAWESPRFEFTVIYGRRRVGKTRLIREYIQDKPAVYFMALEADERTNLEGLSRAYTAALARIVNPATHGIPRTVHPTDTSGEPKPATHETATAATDTTHLPVAAPTRARHVSFEDLFADMADTARTHPFVLVIDEFPFLAQSYPPISSLLQRFCDTDFAATKLHLILCGSSMSFMERQVLSARSPLYGRRTGQIRLRPFDFTDTEDFLAGMSREDAALLYAATGGVAEYLDFVDTSVCAEENLIRLFFEPSGRLVEEPDNLLKQELREPKRYSTILAAIASGASKNNQIATKTAISSGALTNYLDALIDLGIVSRETPWVAPGARGAVGSGGADSRGASPDGGRSGRNTIYRIQDGCFRFWYRFVWANLSPIEMYAGRAAFQATVAPELNSFMGLGFEQIVADLFDRANATGELAEFYPSRGRWWGTDPDTHQAEEIDLVAGSKTTTLFMEAKWVNRLVGVDVLETLERRSSLVPTPGKRRKHYAIYAKQGFTPELEALGKDRSDLALYSFLI